MNVWSRYALAILVRICQLTTQPAIPSAANHDSLRVDLGAILEGDFANRIPHALLVPILSPVAVTFSSLKLIPLPSQKLGGIQRFSAGPDPCHEDLGRRNQW
jgi:hypothetical protein